MCEISLPIDPEYNIQFMFNMSKDISTIAREIFNNTDELIQRC